MTVDPKAAKGLIVAALRGNVQMGEHGRPQNMDDYAKWEAKTSARRALADDLEAGRLAVMPTQAGRFVHEREDGYYVDCPASEATAFVPVADGALAVSMEALVGECTLLREIAKATLKCPCYCELNGRVCPVDVPLTRLKDAGVKL